MLNVVQLVGFKCIELRPIHWDDPKGGLCTNYTTDERTWFTFPKIPERYGVLIKPNNLIVIDIDRPDLMPLSKFPKTFTVGTSRGYHLYYWNPDGIKKPKGGVSWGEIKDNGHIVGPGVFHEDGTMYQVLFPDQPIIALRIDTDLPFDTTNQHAGSVNVGRVDKPGRYHRATIQEIQAIIQGQPLVQTKLLRINQGDRSGNDYLLCKCLADNHIHPDDIKTALQEFGSSKVQDRGGRYVNFTIRNAIRDAQNYHILRADRGFISKNKEDGNLLSNGYGRTPPPEIVETLAMIEVGDKYYCVSRKRGTKGLFYSLDSGWIQLAMDNKTKVPGPAKSFMSIPDDPSKVKELCDGLMTICNGKDIVLDDPDTDKGTNKKKER